MTLCSPMSHLTPMTQLLHGSQTHLTVHRCRELLSDERSGGQEPSTGFGQGAKLSYRLHGLREDVFRAAGLAGR